MRTIECSIVSACPCIRVYIINRSLLADACGGGGDADKKGALARRNCKGFSRTLNNNQVQN
jgi:hypothetical protein